MLGVYSKREPITPEFSKEIRAALRRSMTGLLNDKEKAARQRLKDSEKYWTMEWKGLHFQNHPLIVRKGRKYETSINTPSQNEQDLCIKCASPVSYIDSVYGNRDPMGEFPQILIDEIAKIMDSYVLI